MPGRKRFSGAPPQRPAGARSGDPKFQRAVSDTSHNLGKLLGEMGQPDEALGRHQQALALRENLARQYPDDPALRDKVAESRDMIRCLGAEGR